MAVSKQIWNRSVLVMAVYMGPIPIYFKPKYINNFKINIKMKMKIINNQGKFVKLFGFQNYWSY